MEREDIEKIAVQKVDGEVLANRICALESAAKISCAGETAEHTLEVAEAFEEWIWRDIKKGE